MNQFILTSKTYSVADINEKINFTAIYNKNQNKSPFKVDHLKYKGLELVYSLKELERADSLSNSKFVKAIAH